MKPSAILYSALYKRDVVSVLVWSGEVFGRDVRKRYATLILSALEQLQANLHHPLIKARTGPAAGLYTFHLRHIRSEVKYPRHFLLFEVDEKDRSVRILRLLHDAMDFEEHLIHKSSTDN